MFCLFPQAGFKSALTYRGDIGIPGYTGFNPSATCVPLAVKSETAYEGKLESLTAAQWRPPFLLQRLPC